MKNKTTLYKIPPWGKNTFFPSFSELMVYCESQIVTYDNKSNLTMHKKCDPSYVPDTAAPG